MTTGVTLTIDEILKLRGLTQQLHLGKSQRVRSLFAGSYLSAFRGRGMEFDEVRPYQAGDDIRTIDWRITARTNQAYTKLFREERERPVILFIDQSATMKFGTRQAFKSIIAARIACIIAWAASATGDRVGAVIFDDNQHSESRPSAGKRGVITLANVLIKYTNTLHYEQQAALPPWHSALNRAHHMVHPGSHVIFISDFRHPNDLTEKQLTLLKRHNDVSLIHVYDVLEKNTPPPGEYTVSNGVQFQRLFFNKKTQQALQFEHMRQCDQFLDDMKRKHGIHTLQVATDADLNTVLTNAFRPKSTRGRHG